MILNLGSGNSPIEGAVNLDINPEAPGVNCVHNLDDLPIIPIPYDENTFDTIFARHILEHLYDTISLFNELYRICKPNATINIDVPHYANPYFWDDPTHIRPFSERTIPFICDENNKIKLGLKGKFEIVGHQLLGKPWSYEEPTVITAIIRVIK